MRTSLRITIVAVAAFGLGVAVCNAPTRPVRAASVEPIALEVDSMERMAYEGLLASFDHELQVEIGKLHESYRARHPSIGEGRLVYQRGKGLFLVPIAAVSSTDAASPTPKK